MKNVVLTEWDEEEQEWVLADTQWDEEKQEWVPAADLLDESIDQVLKSSDEADDEAVENVFCPTKKGGGIDPTCSPGQSKGD